MYKTISTIILLITLGGALNAQYSDHRNRQVDSLEQILATNPPTGEDLVHIYQDLMWGYRRINTAKSMEYARKGMEIAISLNDLSDFYGNLAVHLYDLMQYDSATVYFNKALETAERMRDFPKQYKESEIDNRLSQNWGNLGNLYNIQGMSTEAIACYQKALPIFEKRGSTRSLSYLYGNIAELYMSMDNREQAEINLLKADSLAYLTGDSLMIATSKKVFSHFYIQTKDYDKALQNAEIAYDYYFSHDEEGENKAVLLNYLSDIYFEGYGDERKAEEYARQALALLDEYGLDIPNEKAVSLRILSSIWLNRGQWREAEQAALEALSLSDSEPANTLTLYDILTKAYAKLDNSDKVWEYLEKGNKLQSLWSTKHYQSAIREMEVKYETEKKETRIATLEEERRLIMWLGIAGAALLLLIVALFLFLWRLNVQKKRVAQQRHQLAEQQVKQLEQEKQLVATQAELDGEVRERIRLARDLHDGLGSILAAAKYNLVDIRKASGMKPAEMERFEAAVGLLDDSMREMRRVAHHLMPEALGNSGLKQSIADFCNSVPNVKFTWYGDESRMDSRMEIMVYRIMHELVSNALKHSGAEHILVEIVRDAENLFLTVQDDGCGFDPQTESEGMGLANIRTRVALMNGSLQIDSESGVGTEIDIELPITNKSMDHGE